MVSIGALSINRAGVTGRRVFGAAGGKIYAELIDTPAPGWLEQGISYSVEDDKAALYQIVKWSEPNDSGVFLDYKADGGAWYRNARVNMSSGISTGTVRRRVGFLPHRATVRDHPWAGSDCAGDHSVGDSVDPGGR